MKKLHSTSVGRDKTRGLQTPRFRLHTGDKNPNDVFVAHYEYIDGDVEVTNVYKIVNILNECIDDYHEKYKDDLGMPRDD